MNQNKPVFVTGMGIVSALGAGVEDNLDKLKNAQSGIGSMEILDSIHRESFPVGEFKCSNKEMIQALGLPEGEPYTRTFLLSLIALREALEGAKLSPPVAAMLISASTVGGMDRSEVYYPSFARKENLEYVKSHTCGYNTGALAQHAGLKGACCTISTACSSAANAIAMGARMIKEGRSSIAIAGASDPLCRFTLNGFNALKILDEKPCQPFDQNRRGLNLGEASAFLVLEAADDASSCRVPPLAKLVGYANTNDAYHQTASSPEGLGAALAMEQALQVAGLKPEAIDYVNVHGTGTENNDLSEGLAMKKVFGDRVPPFSSTKSFTGHTLAAAGAVEAVFSILALREQVIFPNLNWETEEESLKISPVTRLLEKQNIRYVMSNSFGFGGNNSCLIFEKVN